MRGECVILRQGLKNAARAGRVIVLADVVLRTGAGVLEALPFLLLPLVLHDVGHGGG